MNINYSDIIALKGLRETYRKENKVIRYHTMCFGIRYINKKRYKICNEKLKDKLSGKNKF